MVFYEKALCVKQKILFFPSGFFASRNSIPALSPRLALGVSRLSPPRLPTDLTHIPCFYSHSWLSLPMGSVHVGFRYS